MKLRLDQRPRRLQYAAAANESYADPEERLYLAAKALLLFRFLSALVRCKNCDA